MSVVTTSTASTATAYSNQRKVDRTSNGVLWAMFWDGTSGITSPMHFRYSTDGGATWADGGGFGFAGTGSTYVPSGSLFIDADDYAHVAYKDRHDGYIRYRRGTPNAGRTSWTWSAAATLSTAVVYLDYPDLIAHSVGTGWKAHVVASSLNGTTNFAYAGTFDIASGGTVTPPAGLTVLGGSYGSSAHTYPAIDFNHTGDGKTVAGGTPHLYVAWSAGVTGTGKGIRFKKATYSGGAWTWGTEREIDSTRYQYEAGGFSWLNCLYDGTRVIIGGMLLGSGYQIMLYERDPADTTTTTRILLDGIASATILARGSMTYDSAGNVYLFGRDNLGAAGSRNLNRRKWTRSTATLGAIETIDASGSDDPYFSAKRGYSGNRAEGIYADGTASPYTITHSSLVLNAAPNAPTLGDVGTIDRAVTNRFPWTFSDPDVGDSQSAANLRYRLTGTSPWTMVNVPNPNNFWDAVAGTFADGDYEWQVQTADQQGAWGPYCTSGFFTVADAPGAPTILAPASGATISTSSYTYVISTPSLQKSEWTLYADDGAGGIGSTILQGPVTVTTGDLRSHTFTGLANNVPVWLSVRVQDVGLWSQPRQQRDPVSYTPPTSPVITLTPIDTTGFGYGTDALIVGITNPAPGAGVPATSYNNVYVDDGLGKGKERVATMLPTNQPWTYALPVSLRDYTGNLWVEAVATNGTSSEVVA